MSGKEFLYRLGSLSPECPLVKKIQIRTETNKDIIKGFTQEQRAIYEDWQHRKYEQLIASDNLEEYKVNHDKLMVNFFESCL